MPILVRNATEMLAVNKSIKDYIVLKSQHHRQLSSYSKVDEILLSKIVRSSVQRGSCLEESKFSIRYIGRLSSKKNVIALKVIYYIVANGIGLQDQYSWKPRLTRSL
jgi:hypothetical protein